ncbi:hypothetical protein [Larkinella humicola]|uniref:Small integral membrane protein n=1 Tax=Larkinella humicola TaxID=2607654 RepID=A0A5N1JBV0_9BACT|nr:hypothetical protein [Larkinella humicola]KAA9349961.1 hypothetical protein F0P93_21225 [Larkinella humicola]
MWTNSPHSGKTIQAVLLLFWALYFSLVLGSNSTDALKALGLLPTDWVFASGNYAMVRTVVGIYHPPVWVAGLFYTGVLVWQAVGAVLLWRAFAATVRQTQHYPQAAYQALTVTIGLWAAFILADEFFLAYEMSGLSATHFSLLIAEIGTLLVFRKE